MVIKPLIKKPVPLQAHFKSSVYVKKIEKVLSAQLCSFLQKNYIAEKFQSGFRHSCVRHCRSWHTHRFDYKLYMYSRACFKMAWSYNQIQISPMSFICHIHNYTSIMRSEMCSLHLTHPSVHTWKQWAARTVQRPGSRSWTFLSEPGSEPHIPWVYLGFKSNALSIRPTTTWPDCLPLCLLKWGVRHLNYQQ